MIPEKKRSTRPLHAERKSEKNGEEHKILHPTEEPDSNGDTDDGDLRDYWRATSVVAVSLDMVFLAALTCGTCARGVAKGAHDRLTMFARVGAHVTFRQPTAPSWNEGPLFVCPTAHAGEPPKPAKPPRADAPPKAVIVPRAPVPPTAPKCGARVLCLAVCLRVFTHPPWGGGGQNS